jgi:hypothetical protein
MDQVGDRKDKREETQDLRGRAIAFRQSPPVSPKLWSILGVGSVLVHLLILFAFLPLSARLATGGSRIVTPIELVTLTGDTSVQIEPNESASNQPDTTDPSSLEIQPTPPIDLLRDRPSPSQSTPAPTPTGSEDIQPSPSPQLSQPPPNSTTESSPTDSPPSSRDTPTEESTSESPNPDVDGDVNGNSDADADADADGTSPNLEGQAEGGGDSSSPGNPGGESVLPTIPIGGGSEGNRRNWGVSLGRIDPPQRDIPTGSLPVSIESQRDVSDSCLAKFSEGQDQVDLPFGEEVTLITIVESDGKVSNVSEPLLNNNPPNSDYIELAKCVIQEWTFEPAYDLDASGQPAYRPTEIIVHVQITNGA